MKGIRPGKPDRPIPAKGSWLTVLWQVELLEQNGRRHSQWLCQCKCGKTVKVMRVKIQDGSKKSCGCLRVEQARERGRKTIHIAIAAHMEAAKKRSADR